MSSCWSHETPSTASQNHAPPPDAHDEVVALRREVAQLHEAMASRAAIEQAKGMLMLGYGLRADQAFAVLSRWSQTDQVKVRDLAERLTENTVASLTSAAHDATPAGAGAASPGPRARPRPPAMAPLESLLGG